MKKILLFVSCFLFALTSCEIDNYEGPDASIHGSILDEQTGELVGSDMENGNAIKVREHGFTNATDAAGYLVNHGVPFRDAHGIVGRLVLLCIEKKIALDDLPLDEYKEICPVFEEDIYDAISMETCVNKRLTTGAPGKAAMEQVIQIYKQYIREYDK